MQNFSFSSHFFLLIKEGLVTIARSVIVGLLAGCCLGFIPGNRGWTSIMWRFKKELLLLMLCRTVS
jgi:hypothetical protein